MRLVLIGDVGASATYHAGDEAMLDAALEELRERVPSGELDVVVVSGDPADTAQRYGVAAVPRIGFDDASVPTRAAKDARLSAVTDAARGRSTALSAEDPAWGVIETVADSDGVLITGGGNLTSAFREHVYERAAIAAIAQVFGRRLVVSGQSLGPRLDPRDRELVGGILATASLVGIREADSTELARALAGPETTVIHTLDDASFLAGATSRPEAVADLAPGEYVVASFPPYGGLLDLDDYVEAVGRLIARAAEVTGLPVVLVPHEAPLDPVERGVDVTMHDRILAAAGLADGRSLTGMDAREVAAVTRDAALSLSGRYHPAVFALAAAVPAVGVTVDDYTARKIRGAFANLGASDLAIPALALLGGQAEQVLAEVWDRREEIASALRASVQEIQPVTVLWWDAVVAALSGEGRRAAEDVPQVAEIRLEEALAAGLAALRRYSLSAAESAGSVLAAAEQLDDLRRTAEEREEQLRARVSELEDALRDGRLATQLLREERAATALEDGDGVASGTGAQELQSLRNEVEALQQQLFERERYAAFLSRRVHDLTVETNQKVAVDEDRERHVSETIVGLQNRVDDLTGSTSWRVTLPMRVVKNPKPYIRKLRGR